MGRRLTPDHDVVVLGVPRRIRMRIVASRPDDSCSDLVTFVRTIPHDPPLLREVLP